MADRRTAAGRTGTGGVDPRTRLLTLLGVFVLVGALFVGVLVDLQAVRPEQYREVGENQRTRERTLDGYRGAILDRGGFVLATSTPGRTVVVDPQMITDPDAVSTLLAPALGMDVQQVRALLLPERDGDRHNVVADDVTEDTVARLQSVFAADDDGVLDGVFVPLQEDRVYPAGTLARPIVGGVDPDEHGVFGVEYQFDEVMQGTPGFERSERGIFGSITGGEYLLEPAVEGHDIVLTIDHRIQYIAEQALIRHCEETLAQGANAVVSDPRTGEILAMATVLRQEDGTCVVPNYNASLVDAYEPGSVMKMVVAAAAIENLGYDRSTMVEVPRTLEFQEHVFREHGNDFVAAPYPLEQIISRSMNLGTIKIATEVGKQALYDYLIGFGFGSPTGLDFKDEVRGNVRDPEDWWDSDFGSIPIGQGMTVNTVQLNAAYNAIANDGLYIEPQLVRSMIDGHGNEIPAPAQSSHAVVAPETAHEVTEILTGVVQGENGTGTQAAVAGYTVAGKTGTAWKVFQSGPKPYGETGDRRYIVSFAGFLPAEDPQLSITVVVDEPVTETTAGLVAAPVFADIAQYAVRVLGIPPGLAGAADLMASENGNGLVHGTAAPATDVGAADGATGDGQDTAVDASEQALAGSAEDDDE